MSTPSLPGQPGPAPAGGPALHRERVWPSAGAWLLPLVPAVFTAVAFGPISLTLSIALGVVVGAAAVAGLVATSPVVEVTADGVLRAGRAVLPGRFVAGVETGRGARARAMRGTDLDARTHLVLRGWVDPVVLVRLDDPDDPVPAWLVSTRSPEHLARALLAVAPSGAVDTTVVAGEPAAGGDEGA